jgi:hypothetical protein
MGDTARENWKRKRGRKPKLPPFVTKWMIESPAWAGLSLAARAALVELVHVYDGFNNGRLTMPVRTLAKRLRCSQDTAGRVLRELDDVGFVDPVLLGTFARRNRKATEYRLTFHRCDVTGALPSKRFMKSIARYDQKDRTVRPEVQRGHNSSPRYDQKDRQAQKDLFDGTTRGAHIESYHGHSAQQGASERAPHSAVASERPASASASDLPSSASSSSSGSVDRPDHHHPSSSAPSPVASKPEAATPERVRKKVKCPRCGAEFDRQHRTDAYCRPCRSAVSQEYSRRRRARRDEEREEQKRLAAERRQRWADETLH